MSKYDALQIEDCGGLNAYREMYFVILGLVISEIQKLQATNGSGIVSGHIGGLFLIG